jgi:hypothetical protein
MWRIAVVSLCGSLVLLGAGTGCGKRQAQVDPDAGVQADGPVAVDTGADTGTDTAPAPDILVPDQHPAPDTGPPPCVPGCPAPTGSSICLAGRAVRLPSLAAKWSGLVKHAAPLTPADGARLDVFDPIAFISNPTGATPLASGAIGAAGCFTVPKVTIPFAGFFTVTIDDDKSTGKDRWVFIGTGEMPQPGKNSVDLEIAAVAKKDVQAWTAELGQDPTGATIAIFIDASGKAVGGVTPLLEGKPPPWTGVGVHFFADDIRTAPYFAKGAAATTKSGMVLMTKAPVKSFTGKKSGCTIESGLGGASPGTLLVRVFRVSGC